MEPMFEPRMAVSRLGRIIFFFAEITDETVCEAIKLCQMIQDESTKKPIEFYLNSPGGSVYSGLALYDYLLSCKAPIVTIGTGIVASMGVLILLAGQRRMATKNTRFMTHQVSSESKGRVSDIGIDYNETKKLEKICNEIINRRTNQSIKSIEKDIKIGDKYMDVTEAMKKNYIHQVIENWKDR
jgi:ATP-dependent Clp protease protease subunit